MRVNSDTEKAVCDPSFSNSSCVVLRGSGAVPYGRARLPADELRHMDYAIWVVFIFDSVSLLILTLEKNCEKWPCFVP